MGRFSAFVLAAGYGTRLRPLTDEIPKPLLPVGTEPLLLSTLRVLHEAGAHEAWVNAHHRVDQILSAINELTFKVHVNHEDEILGTAGGVAAVRGSLVAPVLLVNGDIVTELPIEPLLEDPSRGLTLAVTAPRWRPGGGGTAPLGTVGLDRAGRVVRLRGETFGQEVTAADYIGVACLGEDCLATLPAVGCLIGDWALPWLRAGGSISTVWSPAPFRDLGTPASYLEANLEWLRGESYVGPAARVGVGVELERSVIGAGAQVSGRGLLRESLVLPGALARAPLHRSIVLPSGNVVEIA